VVSAVSAAIVLAVLGFLAYEALRVGSGPASVTAAVTNTIRVDHQYLVEVAIRNDGSRAVSDVFVEGTAPGHSGETIRNFVSVAHVPAYTTRTATLVFERDPSGTIAVRVMGYVAP
jgi:uncharacterized protein (TIGR02588 family)